MAAKAIAVPRPAGELTQRQLREAIRRGWRFCAHCGVPVLRLPTKRGPDGTLVGEIVRTAAMTVHHSLPPTRLGSYGCDACWARHQAEQADKRWLASRAPDLLEACLRAYQALEEGQPGQAADWLREAIERVQRGPQ